MFVLNCILLLITIILHFILVFSEILSVFSNLLTISFLVYLVYLSYIYRSVFLQNIFLKNKCLNVVFAVSLVICFLSGCSLFYFNNVHEYEYASTVMNVILFVSFLILNGIDLFGYAYLIYTITRKKIESSVSTRNKTINILTLVFIILYVVNKIILIVFFEVGTDSADTSPSKSHVAFILFIIFIYVDYVILISFTSVKLYQYFDRTLGKGTTTLEKSSGEKTTPKSNHNSRNDKDSKDSDSKPTKSAEHSEDEEGQAIKTETEEKEEEKKEQEIDNSKDNSKENSKENTYYAFYVNRQAQSAFEDFAKQTGGKAAPLDVNSPQGAEDLTNAVAEAVLRDVGGDEYVAIYRSKFKKGFM